MKIKYVVIGCVVFFAGLIVTAIVIPKITTDNFVRVDLNTERYMLNEFGLYDAQNYRIHQNSKGFIKIMHNQDGRWVEWKGKTQKMRMMEEMEKALNKIEPGSRPTEVRGENVRGFIQWNDN